MTLIALLGALLIGICLGLLGSGGSILTVPALVFIVGEPDKVAILESLAIVGGISAFAALPHALQKHVDLQAVFFFGVSGMAGAYIGAKGSLWIPGSVLMCLFALVMLLAAYKMLQDEPEKTSSPMHTPFTLMGNGFLLGCLTGLIGVGGGFLIVPALVVLVGLPIPVAVGTSLVIITLNCVAGFAQHVNHGDLMREIHWHIVLLFVGIGVLGSFLGNYFGSRLPQQSLKKGFGIFILILGCYTLWSQVEAKSQRFIAEVSRQNID